MMKLMAKLKPYWKLVALSILMLSVQSICNLMLPNLMSSIVNDGVETGATQVILQIGVMMLGVALLSAGADACANYFSSKAAMSFGRDLRSITFRKITGYSLHEADKIGTASLITRSTNDILQMQNMIQMQMRMIVNIPLQMIGGIVMAISKDPALSLVVAAAMPILAVVVVCNIRWVSPLFSVMQKRLDAVNRVLRENLSGIRVIRAFNRITQESKRFNDANKELTDTSLSAFRRMASMMPLTMLVMNAAILAILWFGNIRVSGGAMTTGDLMAFIQYVSQILMSVIMASFMLNMIPRAMASARRIVEVWDMEPEVLDPETPKLPQKGVQGSVKFENVSFQYPGAERPILENLSFEANPGETVAIIGGTGSGKSTLISLIPRFYDVSTGRITVDGVDVRQMDQHDLRNRIGYVPQKALLFTGSICDNIRYGKKDATEEEIRAAADIAQATSFIENMEDGFDSYLSQDATNVSGGQKQRLSIARAVVRRPEIYIFDDSFSALDFKTDAALREALKPVTRESTVLIVAQRVSTVMNADRILVLDEGKIVGLGTHKELMKDCEVYREIVASQLREEEIA
ncbi:MAG: ABC transporter ATP-binding protein [Oscillospiraceae bacterium]|jgi:ATP-binding cassette subfamily B multidrug efflux pump|nr:ABC transporter ATP-binding protein [Oscillospiraceae bacterium]